jgi:aminocarboxymuconate-semialdehyde decarboxylase
LKIDIHTHIIPEHLPNFKEKYGYGGFISLEHHKPRCAKMMKDGEFFREIECNCWDAEQRIKEGIEFGVDVQVLSTIPVLFNYWAKPEHTLDASKFLNDHIAEVVGINPNKFIGLGTIPMQHVDYAIQEMERCVKELNFPGIEIGTNINGVNLDDENIFRIFEAAQDLNCSIFVHPWDMVGKERMKKYWLPWLVGMPAENTIAICSMIFGGVFERLPNLKVCFAHGGGSFPATLGRIEHGFYARPDLVAVDNDKPPRDYIGQFYIDSLVHDEKMLTFLLDLIGANRIALGSDYPFPLGELKPGELIESMNLPNEVKEQLLYKTALDWLGLESI